MSVFAVTHPAHVCAFLGCTTLVANPDYPWQMCTACYDMACEWDDSELEADDQ